MVNYVGIIVASVVSFIIGMLWYSPVLFGNAWIKFSRVNMEKTKKKSDIGKSMTLGFVSTLVLVYVFQYLMSLLEYTGTASGAMLGFWFWLGFLATSQTGGSLWEGKPWGLYFLNVAYWLINLVAIGAVLGYWMA